MSNPKNVRTATLRKYINDGTIRLGADDREFLRDLAKVRIIDEKDAANFHYTDKKTPSRRLEKLCQAGVLERIDVNQPGRGNFKAYTFKSDSVATLFGGKRPVIGRKRNALHEVITSKLFFAEGRPDSFCLEADFSKQQKELFKLSAPSLTGRNSSLPDAMYINSSGEMVVVEADSGQYSNKQIMSKQAEWGGFKQVWGQPSKSAAKASNVKVHLF